MCPRRSRRGSGAVTLHDVAKLAGVAPITASRALSKPAQVSPEVLKRVTEAVSRTGYVRNHLAGSLASTRSRLVAAVVPTISGNVLVEVVQSLTASLAAYGTPRPYGAVSVRLVLYVGVGLPPGGLWGEVVAARWHPRGGPNTTA